MGNGNSKSWSEPETVLKTVEILLIIAAGIWTLFMFFKFEASEREISKSLLETQRLQGNLNLKLDSLEMAKSIIDLDRMTGSQLEFDDHIDITDFGQVGSTDEHRYLVQFGYEIKNIGSTKNEVTYIIVNSYLANLDPGLEKKAIEIVSFGVTGDMSWSRLFTKAFWYGPKYIEGKDLKVDSVTSIPYIRGGGGTSELDCGEASQGSVQLIVRARPYDLIGFETRIGINGGDKPSDRWRLRDMTYLAPSDKY